VNAAELDERRKGSLKGVLVGLENRAPYVAIECAKIEALFLIAIQLAELNEKLTPARLVSAIEEIQAEIEKHDRRRKDSGGGPP
jgi:hypothetical protein